MSYANSNPFYTQGNSSNPPASTSKATERRLLFTGLPPDVKDQDVSDLLYGAKDLSLPPSAIKVGTIHSADGKFTGEALVTITTDAERHAEAIRRLFSGQPIDQSFKLLIQHVLPATQPLPPQTVQPFQPGTPETSITSPAKYESANGTKGNEKPPGLKLLARMSKPGLPPDKPNQAALLAQQKANMKAKMSSNLLSRLKPSKKPTGQPTARRTVSAGTIAKVGRAKAKAGGPSPMEVDRPSQVKKESSGKKTQAQLDEEMRAYDRQRRFGAGA